MANCENNRNPLQRSGTSQQQRQLPGMLPDHVLIDEKKFGDWIVFATEFSKHLAYHEPATGAASGNWLPFFQSDISAMLGGIAVQNIETYRTHIRERMSYIKDNDHAGNENKLKSTLNELFSAVFTLAKSLDDNYLRLADEVIYSATLQQLIKVKLAPAYRRMIAYYYGAKELHLIRNFEDGINWNILNLPLTDADVILEETMSGIWWTEAIKSKADIVADKSIFGDEAWADVFRQVSHAANHHLFASVLDLFTGTYTRIISEAEKHLLITLEQLDTHAPHYTLFLTFLKLFRNIQSQINGLTWRHLDYYYKEVLRLKPEQAIPNQAHLVAELAKHIGSAALPKGTQFKAGKDSEGKEVTYTLDNETTFNKAEVALFKTVYKGSLNGADDIKDNGGNVVINNKGRLFASPVTNSADGAGAKLKTANKEWHPFINKQFNEENNLSDIAMPEAQIGFAVASHYLFLSEGSRKVRIRLDATGPSMSTAHFTCYLTTAKEWLALTPSGIAPASFSSDYTACTEILINIPATAPAITAYDAKVHGGTFHTDTPIIKCILNNVPGTTAYEYEALKTVTISKVEILVEAGGITNSYNQDGIKQLQLSNHNGALDASKPFQPFTAVPAKDMPLVIGNKELFSKKNASFNLNIEWANRPTSMPSSPGAVLQFLEGGKWTTKSVTFTGNVVSPASTHIAFSGLVPITENSTVNYKDDYNPFDSATRSGFMRLVLTGNFGHENYNKLLTLYLINKAKPEVPKGTTEPAAPYTPTIQSLYLSYSAYNSPVTLTTVNETAFGKRPVQFYHVGPFGEAERNANVSAADTTIHLLPHFEEYNTVQKDANGVSIKDFTSDFYIGVKDLQASQSVNILFQLLEGSTNPLISKPEKHVHWSYMSNNHWLPFDDRHISDATRQLVSSGIISFSIPEDATTGNTLLPPGYVWLKASVSEAAEAVCKILSVQAQAMVVSYQPNNNAQNFLDNALTTGTISKLKIPNASFKKTEQPYSSFGGRQTENSKQFYLRSSERLRHKGRAVTIWDYEHLVLEAFPQLHKVKCLNHTQIEDNPDATKSIYNETRPGYVAIITIPNMINRNDANPLKPYTNQNLLSEIKAFLEQRISGHVNLNVCNPLFEEVRIEFRLQLKDGYDDFTYYDSLLQQQITQYLSPWAYDLQTEVQFGGKISKSQLVNFIEEQYYVDFITEVKLYHKPGSNVPESTTDYEEVIATTARSILVSAPAIKHKIDVYQAPASVTQKECNYI